MKTIEQILSGMEVRGAYEAGRKAGRLEMAHEADARWEKAHVEAVDGLDRVIGMVEEVPGKVLKAAIEAAEEAERKARELVEAREWVDEEEEVEDEQVERVEDRGKWSVDDDMWQLDGEVEERVVIALPLDVAATLMRVRAVDEAVNL